MSTTHPAPGPRTLFDKVWDAHVVTRLRDDHDLLYVDLHLVQEVSSPQAFDVLRRDGLPVRRPDLTLATADHSVPTLDRLLQIRDVASRQQVDALEQNCADFGVPLHDLRSPDQGIVHVIGPEQGLTQPGMTIVCGDSHTTTHGAFGALAFGIGTSEVAHVLATQCTVQRRPRTLRVDISGKLGHGVTAKDLALAVVRELDGSGTGHVIEYTGAAVRALSMEGRMTLANMSIEAGARAAMIAPDRTTFDYLHGRRHAPSGALWTAALGAWSDLVADPGARYDREVALDASAVAPTVTWGTTPAMSTTIDGVVPRPEDTPDPVSSAAALEYVGLRPGQRIQDIAVDVVFIGSCTNGRIEDLRAAADVLRGQRVAANVRAMVVPGSTWVKRQAESEGLDRVFLDAGFEWRESGCSMCLAMSPDVVAPGERCASTSNRNFEGRQGQGSRTHLVSPATAAAAAVHGRFVDVRELGVAEPSKQ